MSQIGSELPAVVASPAGAALEFQGHEPRQQRRRVELADDGLEIGQAAGDRMHRHDVAVSGGGQRHEAEIDQVVGEPRGIAYRQAVEGFGKTQPDKCIKGDEHHRDSQIKQDGPDDAVIGDGTGTEDRAANDHGERECDDDVSRRVEIDVDCRGAVQAQSRTYGAQRQGDAHCQRGRNASGKDHHADDEYEQDPEADRLRLKQAGSVNRHDDEHQRRHDDGQCGQ
jgi:hypothetical protein